MRKLNFSDLFATARVVRASGMRPELKKIIKDFSVKGSFDIEDIGMDGLLTVLECLAERNAEEAIYIALSGPFEMTPDEVSSLSADELFDRFKQLSEDNDIKGFFTSLSGILGKR